MKKTAVILIILSILSKPIGFVRQLLISYFFGATNITDAYFIATSALSILMIYFIAVSKSYIPTYNKVLQRDGEQNAFCFTNKLISIQLLGIIILIVVAFIFSDIVVNLLASGFDNETSLIAQNMLIILLLSLPIIVISNELSSFLNIKGKSVQRALASYSSHIIIIFIILAGYFSIYLLPIGAVVSSLAFLVLLIWLVRKQGLKLSFKVNLDNDIKYALFFALPIVLNNSIRLINQIVDQNIGSRLGEGIISAINYSTSVQNLLMDGVIALILINVIFPKLANLSQKNSKDAILTYRKVLVIFLSISIPISFLFYFFGQDIISFIYLRGAFSQSNVDMSSIVLSVMSISLPFMIYNMLCNNMLFVYHLSKWPMVLSIVVVISNVFFSILLSYFYGLHGLILGTVISVVLGAVTSAIIFKYKIAPLELKVLFSKIIRIVLVSIIVTVLAFYVRNLLEGYISRNLTTIVYIFISASMYLLLLQFTKIQEIDIIRKSTLSYLKSKLNKN